MRGHAADAVMRSEQGRDRRWRGFREGTSYRGDPDSGVLGQSASHGGECLQRAAFVVGCHGGVGQEREDRFPVRLLGMPGIECDERAASIPPAALISTGMSLADLLSYLIRQLLD